VRTIILLLASLALATVSRTANAKSGTPYLPNGRALGLSVTKFTETLSLDESVTELTFRLSALRRNAIGLELDAGDLPPSTPHRSRRHPRWRSRIQSVAPRRDPRASGGCQCNPRNRRRRAAHPRRARGGQRDRPNAIARRTPPRPPTPLLSERGRTVSSLESGGRICSLAQVKGDSLPTTVPPRSPNGGSKYSRPRECRPPRCLAAPCFPNQGSGAVQAP